MKITITILITLFLLSTGAFAGSTATQTFNVAISEINEFVINPGDRPDFHITATDFGTLSSATRTNDGLTYDITTNGTNKKITGQITSGGDFASNFILAGYFWPRAFGSTEGVTVLRAGYAVDMITGIGTVSSSSALNKIEHRFTAGVNAGPLTRTSKTVTYTLTSM